MWRENKTWSLYIDLKSAFDSVDHELMFKRMRMRNIPKKLINTISWFYLQTKFKIGKEEIDINRGVI